jgi:hypothetical protein
MKPERIVAAFLNGSHKDHIKSWRIAYNGVALEHRSETVNDVLARMPDDPCYTAISPTGVRLNFTALAYLYVG